VITHIAIGNSRPLCGSCSLVALVNSADCETCTRRFDKLLALALDITEDRPKAVERMKRFIKKLGVCRPQAEQPEPPATDNV
jgi:hypothetical protein